MKYFIEINETANSFEVVYFEGEKKKVNFNTIEDAMNFASDCDFSHTYNI